MSGARGTGPSPDGHHDDLLPEELAGLTLHAPDDPRELDADRERWLHEAQTLPPASPLRSLQERRSAQRRRLVITASVVLISMLGVALSGAVGAWIWGPHAASPPAAPLATGGPPPGEVGGLLPDVTVFAGSTPVSAQSLRPAVLALVPPSCPTCAELLASIEPDIHSFGVSLAVVGGSGQAAQLDALSAAVGPTRLATVTDPAGALASTYQADGVTLLLVRDDGVLLDVVRDPPPGVHLQADLVDLVPAIGLST